MSDSFVQVAPDSTGKKVDVSQLTVSAQTVERQRMVIADDATAAALAAVLNTAPVGTEYGLVVRPQPALIGEGYAVFTAVAVTAIALLSCGDCLAYNWAEVQITANAGADTVTFQASNDNSTWVSCTLFPSNVTQSAGVTSTTSTGLWAGPIPGRYFTLIKNAAVNAVSATVVVKQTVGVPPAIGGTVSLTPATSSGNDDVAFRLNSAASINATLIKNGSGILKSYDIANTNAAVRYVKFYNTASTPAPATDAALLLTVIRVPALDSKSFAYGTYGLGFSAGIGLATTTGAADTDVGAVGAGDLLITVGRS